jgi:hypothetical protein
MSDCYYVSMGTFFFGTLCFFSGTAIGFTIRGLYKEIVKKRTGARR